MRLLVLMMAAALFGCPEQMRCSPYIVDGEHRGQVCENSVQMCVSKGGEVKCVPK